MGPAHPAQFLLSRLLLGLLLLSAPAAAQTPASAAPWSDLLPILDRTELVVVAEVEHVRIVPQLGTQVRVLVRESLRGRFRTGRKLTYLTESKQVVRTGQRELLLLRRPERNGFYHGLVAKVGAQDPAQESKLAWMRQILRIRLLEPEKQARSFVRFYLRSLQSEQEPTRRRALDELERLRRLRERELYRLCAVSDFKLALEGFPEGEDKKRLQALLKWRKQKLGRDSR